MFRDLGAGVDPRSKTAWVNLAGALAAYLKNTALAPRSKENYSYTLSRYFADWADLPLAEITRDMVEARYRTVAEEVEARFASRPAPAPASTWLWQRRSRRRGRKRPSVIAPRQKPFTLLTRGRQPPTRRCGCFVRSTTIRWTGPRTCRQSGSAITPVA